MMATAGRKRGRYSAFGVAITMVAALTASASASASDPIPNGPSPLQNTTVDTCKLDAEQNPLGLGFQIPTVQDHTPTTGTLTISTIYVDFSDAPTTRSITALHNDLESNVQDYYGDMSYGQLTVQLDSHVDQWFRLSQPSAHYGNGLLSFTGHRMFIEEAIALADPVVDFSEADVVLVVANPSASAIPFGPVTILGPDDGFLADGNLIPSGITSGHDLLVWGGIWLAHELGHVFGLPDLYVIGEASDFHRYVGDFGIMGRIDGFAPHMFAYERWSMGWIDDSQIECHTTGTSTYQLEPVARQTGGKKAVVVPISDSQRLVVESRRDITYDRNMPEEGALVYVIDGMVRTRQGPLRVSPGVDTGSRKQAALLSPGESFSYGDVTVAITAAGAGGDTVTIDSSPRCDGRRATIVGTAGNDVLRGTSGVDVIMGLEGDDVIYGYNGADVICGGEGRDRIFGGKRGDIIYGGPDNDRIFGDVGGDMLFGDEGNDRLLGGQGDDAMAGGRGKRDRLFAGPGIDSCVDAQAATRRADCEQ